jgi:hypothetical protein
MAASIEQLSFELTASALAEQERTLHGMRVCAGTVIGSGSIASSFLGARAVSGPLDSWSVLGTAMFVLCFLAAVWVLAPHEMVFAFAGMDLLVESDARRTSDVSEGYRAAGRWIEPHLRANWRTLDRLANWLTLSCLLLGVEIVAWTMSLVG